jgi:hypothetical protein
MPWESGDVAKVQITDHRLTTSPNTGTWGLSLALLHEEKGQLFHTLWLTEATAGMVRKFLHDVDLDPDKVEIEQLDPDHPDGISVLGKELEVAVEDEEYKGKVRLKVKRIGKPAPPIQSPEAKKDFARLNAAIRAAKKRDDAPALEEDDATLGDNLMTDQERKAEEVKKMAVAGKKKNPLE